MIELQAKCVCDGCKKEQESIGVPSHINARSLIERRNLLEDLYYSIPTGWRWVHSILLCKECFDSRFKDLFDASNI